MLAAGKWAEVALTCCVVANAFRSGGRPATPSDFDPFHLLPRPEKKPTPKVKVPITVLKDAFLSAGRRSSNQQPRQKGK